MTGPSACSGWGRGRPSGWGGSLSRGAGARRHAGETREDLRRPGPPLPAPRPGAARPAEGVRPFPGVLSALPTMPGRHSGRLGPHPPGVLRTQRRGLAPSQLGSGQVDATGVSPGPSTSRRPRRPTPRPIAWVSVSFPPRHTSTWPKASPARHPITPPLYHPVPLPLSNAFSDGLLAQALGGPCHLPDLHPPPRTLRYPPSVPLPAHTLLGCLSEPAAPPCPLPSRLTFSLHSFMAGTHAIVRDT